GRRLGAAGQGSQPTLGLYQEVIGLALPKRPLFPVTGDGATDQAWVALAQAFAVVPELGKGAGLEVLQEHIGPCQQRLEQAPVLALAQVDDDGFFAAVQPDEMRALPAYDLVVLAR